MPSAVSWNLLGIDAQGTQDACLHIVNTSQHGQFHELALAEPGAQRIEDLVAHVDVKRHGLGECDDRALSCVEEIFHGRPSPFPLQRLALREAESFASRLCGDMVANNVFDAIQVGDTDDDDFPKRAVKRGLPSHRTVELKPCKCQGRRMQQQLVDVDEPATSLLDAPDGFPERRVVAFFDHTDARHGRFPEKMTRPA